MKVIRRKIHKIHKNSPSQFNCSRITPNVPLKCLRYPIYASFRVVTSNEAGALGGKNRVHVACAIFK